MARSVVDKTNEVASSTKARILAAAERIFAARGFEGASTREIAAASEANISSLHYHWESKETLYYAVFERIYDQLVEVVRSSIPDPSASPPNPQIVDEAVGRLFDFFADHPDIAKLLVRRLLETTEGTSEIERDILQPAWRSFATWTYDAGTLQLEDVDAQIFMLTVHSVLLVFMLDSQQFVGLLGGSVRSRALRPRLRSHIIGLVHGLIRNASSKSQP